LKLKIGNYRVSNFTNYRNFTRSLDGICTS